MMEQNKEEILKRVTKHKNTEEIHISRVPKKTVDLFKEFADDFCGDYGMALKHLLDFALTFGPALEGVYSTLSEHEQRLDKLESTSSKTPQRTTMGGRVIGKRKEE